MIGVHAKNAADSLALALGGVVHVAAGLDAAGVYAEEHQTADERVHHDLEGQRGKGFVVGGCALNFFALVLGRALYRGHVHRRGQIVHNRVEQRLNALVAIRRTAQNRVHLARDGRLTDRALDLVDRELVSFKELLHQLVVGLGDGFDQLVVILFRLLAVFLGNIVHFHLRAEIVLIDLRLHLNKVNDSLKCAFRADGQLDRHRVGVQLFPHHLYNAEEVRARDVHLVYISQTRHGVFGGLTPNRFALRFHAALCTEHGHGTVEHAKGAFHLHGEVYVAGRVDDVDLVSAPFAGGGGRGNGDAALLLLLHPVHRGHTLVHLAKAMRASRIEQDAFGRRGFSGVDVRHDADVAYMIK